MAWWWYPRPWRWKLLWHRYLRVYDGKGRDSKPLFEHGWIELGTATHPTAQWSAGRKLFIGQAYNKANNSNNNNNNNNNTIGPPEFSLRRLASSKDILGRCAAFTEPGMIAREDGIYLVMKCATGSPGNRTLLSP